MNNRGISHIVPIVIISVVVVATAGALIWYNTRPSTTDTTNQTACTDEAKLCPDGSYVGRTGASCEFAACPTEETNENANDNVNRGTSTNVNMEVFTNTSSNTNTTTETTEYPFSELIQDYLVNSLRVGSFVIMDATVVEVNLEDDVVLIGASASATQTVPLRITDDTGSTPTNVGQGYVIYFSVTSPTTDPILDSAGQPSGQMGY